MKTIFKLFGLLFLAVVFNCFISWICKVFIGFSAESVFTVLSIVEAYLFFSVFPEVMQNDDA